MTTVTEANAAYVVVITVPTNYDFAPQYFNTTTEEEGKSVVVSIITTVAIL